MRSMPPRKNTPSFWHRPDAPPVLLHLGENPFPPTARVQQAIAEAAQFGNRYPDTNAVPLRKKLAEYIGYGVTPDNIIVGNGSDDLIDLAVVTFTEECEPILTFEPTFFIYTLCAQRHGRASLKRKLDENYFLPSPVGLDISSDVKLTFIAHPNNPTATLTPRERLIEWLERLPGVVVVDECYFEYSGTTVADLIPRFPNLIVFRSMSKSFSLSGLRLGYAIANRPWIEMLENHALTFPVNALAQAAGFAALDDLKEYQSRIAQMIAERDALAAELTQMGYRVLPSTTNFLLVLGVKENTASSLAERGVYVSDQSPAMGCPAIRIAVGTPEQNRLLLQTLLAIH